MDENRVEKLERLLQTYQQRLQELKQEEVKVQTNIEELQTELGTEKNPQSASSTTDTLRAEIEALLGQHKKNLEMFNDLKARFGTFQIPPHVSYAIDSTETEIKRLQTRLASLR